jgi:hypothetical protein
MVTNERLHAEKQALQKSCNRHLKGQRPLTRQRSEAPTGPDKSDGTSGVPEKGFTGPAGQGPFPAPDSVRNTGATPFSEREENDIEGGGFPKSACRPTSFRAKGLNTSDRTGESRGKGLKTDGNTKTSGE